MNKLCNCKKQFISAIFFSVLRDINTDQFGDFESDREYCNHRTSEVAKIAESECVCSLGTNCPHELNVSNSIPSKTANSSFLVEDQLGYFSKEEKKECEHEWKELKSKHQEYFPGYDNLVINEYQTGTWWCHECGLVTCVDPSRSAPSLDSSKNPNQE